MVEQRVEDLVDNSDPLASHLEARRDLERSRLGMAIPGQVNVTDAEGTVHNFVGAQTVPLSYARDGGPYLDETEERRVELRKNYVLAAPNTVTVDDIHPSLRESPSVVTQADKNDVEAARDSVNAQQVGGSKSEFELDPEIVREPSDAELFGTDPETTDNDENTETTNDSEADVDERSAN